MHASVLMTPLLCLYIYMGSKRNAYYTTVKGAAAAQILTLVDTIWCYKHTEFHAIPLHGLGEMLFPPQKYLYA